MTSLLALWTDHVDPSSLRTLLAAAGTLPVPPVTDRAFWDTAHPLTRDAVTARAAGELGAPWPQPLTSAYARFFRDGNRTDYEDQVRERQHRLSRAALMAAWTDDEEWLDAVVDAVVLLCEQSSWSWAAHDDTFSVRGHVVPSPAHPYLDLGAGEVVAQLAWIDALLGPALDARAPGVRARIRHEAQARVFTPFRERRDWHWLGLTGPVHNWNPWIHGNILAGALALVDDLDDRAELVTLVVTGLDRFAAALPADGAIDEGYSYWWNGAGRLLEALELLTRASGGLVDWTTVPAVAETVRFPHRMQIDGPWYVNVADGPARPTSDQPWHVLHRWGALLDDDAVRAHAASHRRPGLPLVHESAGLGRALRGLSDPAWTTASPAPAPLVADVWLPSVELLLAREQAGSATGLTLAAKGGHNGENHNHKDVGSFTVAIDGVPVVVDAGQPTYTAQTFGPDRYQIWTMQSAWHNVPAPVAGAPGEPAGQSAPTEQGLGASFAARHVTVSLTPGRAELSLDLAAAYQVPDLTSWVRTVALDRPEPTTGTGAAPLPARVQVTDAWTVTTLPPVPAGGARTAPAPTGQAIHLLLHGALVEEGPGRLRVTPPGTDRGVLISWDLARAAATTTARPLDDPLLTTVWGDHLTRLELTATGPAESGAAETGPAESGAAGSGPAESGPATTGPASSGTLVVSIVAAPAQGHAAPGHSAPGPS